MSFQTVYLPSIQGITRVQNAAGGVGATNANNFVITFGQNYVAGNMICVALCSQGPQVNSIASTGGVIEFSQMAPPGGDTVGSIYTYLYLGKVITGANARLTVTTVDASTKTICAVAAEYSGINISSDTIFISSTNAAGSSINLGTLTNNQSSALYIGAVGQRFTTAAPNTTFLSSPSSPFTIVQQISTNLNGTNQDRGVGLLDAVVSTSAARTMTVASGFVNRFSGVMGVAAEIPAAVPTGAAW